MGALGIPVQALEWLNAREYGFHNTELSWIVRNAAHALAIDEFRVDYQTTLWAPMSRCGLQSSEPQIYLTNAAT